MSEKQLLVIAGPNGAGKTTFAEEARRATNAKYLAADAIAAELRPDAVDTVAIEAGREFLRRLSDDISRGEDLIVESTLSGKSLLRHIASAKQSGYVVLIFFTYLDAADSAVARVKARVAKGGHNVPEQDVRRRFGRSIRNFWHEYRFASDLWGLYENSGGSFLAVANGRADNLEVRDAGRFASFLRLAGVDHP